MAAWNPSATRAASCLCGQVAERGCVHHGRGLTTSARSKRKGLRANLKGLVFNDYDFGGFLTMPAFRSSSTGAPSCSAAISSSATPRPSACVARSRWATSSIAMVSSGRSFERASRPTNCWGVCQAGDPPSATMSRPSSRGGTESIHVRFQIHHSDQTPRKHEQH